MKNSLGLVVFIGISNIGLATIPTPQSFTATHSGEQARTLYGHLSERLLTSSIISEGVQHRVKAAWSMECWEDTALISGESSYGCSQLFFDYGYTSNPSFNYDIPAPDPSGAQAQYLLLEYTGSLAARLHDLLSFEYPTDVENCSLEQPCITSEGLEDSEYVLSIARGLDLSCYQIAAAQLEDRYSCAHYIADQDGAVIPVGGDPIIGVVLGGLRLEDDVL